MKLWELKNNLGLLAKLNSLTKYPSIPTYHALGDKGRLTEQTNVQFGADEAISVAEKIDGTNARVIILEDGYIIGSREELLYSSTDLLHNPSQQIVETVLPYMGQMPMDETGICVAYGGCSAVK